MNYWEAMHKFTDVLNGRRAAFGSGPVSLNRQMCDDCQLHNAFMVDINDLRHSTYNMSENVARVGHPRDNSAALCTALTMWWNSEDGHRGNLLAQGREIGIALYWKHDGEVYATFRIR